MVEIPNLGNFPKTRKNHALLSHSTYSALFLFMWGCIRFWFGVVKVISQLSRTLQSWKIELFWIPKWGISLKHEKTTPFWNFSIGGYCLYTCQLASVFGLESFEKFPKAAEQLKVVPVKKVEIPNLGNFPKTRKNHAPFSQSNYWALFLFM